MGLDFSVKYVLNRSIVQKIQAKKFAVLAVVIPILFWVVAFLLGGMSIYNIFGSILIVVIVFLSINQLIVTQGD